jgi:hypothetical protein
MYSKKEGKVLPKIFIDELEHDIAIGIARALRSDFPNLKIAAGNLAEINMETLKKMVQRLQHTIRREPDSAGERIAFRATNVMGDDGDHRIKQKVLRSEIKSMHRAWWFSRNCSHLSWNSEHDKVNVW